MIYSYVEDNPVKELGSIIREDKELTLEIVGEDNLFEAGGVWVFYSKYQKGKKGKQVNERKN